MTIKSLESQLRTIDRLIKNLSGERDELLQKISAYRQCLVDNKRK